MQVKRRVLLGCLTLVRIPNPFGCNTRRCLCIYLFRKKRRRKSKEVKNDRKIMTETSHAYLLLSGAFRQHVSIPHIVDFYVACEFRVVGILPPFICDHRRNAS